MSTPASAVKVWRAALVTLRARHPEISRQWFDDIQPLELSGGMLTLRAPDRMRRRYLERTALGAFQAAAQEATGRLLAIRFLDEAQQASAAEAPPALDEPPPRRRSTPPAPPAGALDGGALDDIDDELLLDPDLIFDAFVVGPSNRIAQTAARAVAEQPGRMYNPLFVHGGVGLGKTHLLHAICHEVLRLDSERNIVFVSCEEFVSRFYAYLGAQRMHDFRTAFRKADLLIVDDIHGLARHKQIQEEFFNTFNANKDRSGQIVLASDASPDEIPQLEARLVSRFSAGLVVRLDPPDFDTRVAILQRKAADRGVDLVEEAAKLIAGRFDDSANIRELEGALTLAQHLAFAEDADRVGPELADRALGVRVGQPTRRASLDRVIAVVVGHYETSLSQLQGRSRRRSVALPRHVCMYIARKHTGRSLEEIGGHFGGRDHSTVLHAVRSVENALEHDDALRATIEHLERQVFDRAAVEASA